MSTYLVSIAAALIGAASCIATLVMVISVSVFDDEPVMQFLIAFLMTICTLACGYNAVFHSVRQWQRYGLTRARRRARALLLRLLTPTQRDEYLAGSPITVPVIIKGESVGHACIGGGISGVYWSASSSHMRYYNGRQCVDVADERLCPEDSLIALLIWLRGDPVGLLSVSHPRNPMQDYYNVTPNNATRRD